MAYRLEMEPNGKEAIVIDGFDQGISPDPYKGLNYALNVNIDTPGEISVGYGITANATSGATLGNPISDSTRWFTYGTPGVPAGSPQSWAVLDANGRVWESTGITGTFAFLSSSNSVTNSSATDGICHWMGYLWKTRGAAVDYWNGSTWATGWAGLTLSAAVKHDMFVGSDNVMYITNGNYLASVSPIGTANNDPTAFDPTGSTTYTASPTKLRLPVEDMAVSIGEVGGGNTPQSTLLVGGIRNAIYPWDKISSSFSLPIYVADNYIAKIVSANQSAFILPGAQTGSGQGRGRIYITNGSQADLYFQVPGYVFGVQDPYFLWGDAIFHRNNLLFSFFPMTNAAALVQNYGYVWALDLTTKYFRAVSQLPTSASFVSNAYCLMSTGNLASPGFGFIAAWNDNSSAPGIGYSGTTAGIGSGSIFTEPVPIGTFMQKRTFSQVEYKLRTPLASGESISIVPYMDGTTATTLVFTPTPGTGTLSGVANVTFQNNQWLQFIIGLTGNSASSGCRLKEIRIR